MRRTELIDAANHISRALTESGVQSALGGPSSSIADLLTLGAGSKRGDDFNAKILTALRKYTLLAQSFSNAAKELTGILDLMILEDPAFWDKLLIREKSSADVIQATASINFNIRFAMNHLPKIARLAEQESLRIVRTLKQESKPEQERKSVISVIIVEESGKFSTPNRIIDVLEGMNALYDSYATILLTFTKVD